MELPEPADDGIGKGTWSTGPNKGRYDLVGMKEEKEAR